MPRVSCMCSFEECMMSRSFFQQICIATYRLTISFKIIYDTLSIMSCVSCQYGSGCMKCSVPSKYDTEGCMMSLLPVSMKPNDSFQYGLKRFMIPNVSNHDGLKIYNVPCVLSVWLKRLVPPSLCQYVSEVCMVRQMYTVECPLLYGPDRCMKSKVS